METRSIGFTEFFGFFGFEGEAFDDMMALDIFCLRRKHVVGELAVKVISGTDDARIDDGSNRQ